MAAGEHDTLVYRLSQILVKLNQGEKLSPKNLADEFGVNIRTIQRDLNIRFAYLPLQKQNGLYSLEPIYLGKLSRKDIDRFAGLAGVNGLFPSLNDAFFKEIFDEAADTALLVKGHSYEDLSNRSSDFNEIKKAIEERRHISIKYQKGDGEKLYPKISPYKLMNHHGIWYLVAVDNEVTKTFSFKKIKEVMTQDNTYQFDVAIDDKLENDDGIWFGQKEIKVVLKISPKVADYFKRRKLIANQKIEKNLEDGSILLSTEVGHFNQVLPIIKYWIPNIEVLEPIELKQQLIEELNYYLNKR